MTLKDYKHIELLEEITIPTKRVKDNKIVNAKDWNPTKPFRLRVKATVMRGENRTIKKKTFSYMICQPYFRQIARHSTQPFQIVTFQLHTLLVTCSYLKNEAVFYCKKSLYIQRLIDLLQPDVSENTWTQISVHFCWYNIICLNHKRFQIIITHKCIKGIECLVNNL